LFPDKALAAEYLPAGRQASVFYRPFTQGMMKLKKNFVLTSKPISSIINIIIKQLQYLCLSIISNQYAEFLEAFEIHEKLQNQCYFKHCL